MSATILTKRSPPPRGIPCSVRCSARHVPMPAQQSRWTCTSASAPAMTVRTSARLPRMSRFGEPGRMSPFCARNSRPASKPARRVRQSARSTITSIAGCARRCAANAPTIAAGHSLRSANAGGRPQMPRAARHRERRCLTVTHCPALSIIAEGGAKRAVALVTGRARGPADPLLLPSFSRAMHSQGKISQYHYNNGHCSWLNSRCCSRQTRLGMRHNFLMATDNPTASSPLMFPPASPAHARWQLGEQIHPLEIIQIFK